MVARDTDKESYLRFVRSSRGGVRWWVAGQSWPGGFWLSTVGGRDVRPGASLSKDSTINVVGVWGCDSYNIYPVDRAPD